MIEKLGPRKFLLPAVMVLVIGGVMALMFSPMLHMAPRALPFAVMSLDEGAQTPQGPLNAGGALVSALAGAPTDGAPIAWTTIESEHELDDAIAHNEYFGALVIPADFSQRQLLAQTAGGEAPTVSVTLDNAKSPMVATQMQAVIGSMFAEKGVVPQMQVVHTGSPNAGSVSPLAGMMSQQIAVMPLMIMSLVASVLLVRIFPRGAGASAAVRYRVVGKRVAYAAGASLLAALTSVWLLNVIVGAAAPFWVTTGFLWFASFAVMTVFLGAFALATPAGGVIAFLTVVLGTMTAVLPAEMLPSFWANWVRPWAPQHFIGDGVRDILYMGSGLMPHGAGGLAVIGAVGVLLLTAAGVQRRTTSSTRPIAAAA